MNQNYEFSDPAPYPEIKVCGTNLRYAEAMLNNMGSCNSEMSAVSRYFYNSIITKNVSNEISDCFHKISIVEMHHLHIFGDLAHLLGADPRLWSYNKRRQVYWTPSYNQYPTQLAAIIQYAIQGEKNTIEKYHKQTQWIQDTTIAEILNRIILDEEHHINILQQLYQNLCSK